jgi:NAD(P)-dependent dehydrogenase (short-subunit alcohol dehydrogenase family)
VTSIDTASPHPSALLLTGKVALVTGATYGIGRAIAIGLAAQGAHVIATGRTQGALEALDDEILSATGSSPTLVPMDLRDGDAIDRLGAAIYERWGHVDVVVGAAGALGVITPISHMDQKAWDTAVAVNLTANFRLIRSMDPLLRKAEAGRLLLLTSSVGRKPRAFWGAYAVSKAGLETLAAIYADEVDNTAIRIGVVNPGPMRTRMRAQAFPGENPQDLTPPDAIVPLVLELVGPGSDPTPQVIDFKTWAASRTESSATV